MAQVTKNKIIFNDQDWLQGLHPQYASNSTDVPVPRGEKGLAYALNISPFRSLGNVTPGPLATDVTNVGAVTGGIIRDVAMGYESSTQYGYLISAGSRFHRLDISSKTLSNSGSWPHTITGAGSITGLNCVSYNSNVASVSTPCIFYSYNDSAGAWNLARYIPSSATFQDTYLTATVASPLTLSGNTAPHPMCVGDDDILYVGDGNVLRAVDGATGANGTAISASLTLPQGYVITSIKKYTPYLVIFAYYSPQGATVAANFESSGPAKAYFWDYLSLDPTYVFDLHDSCVSTGFEYQGTIGCFTAGPAYSQELGGPNRFTRLQLFDGAKFDTVLNMIGNPPIDGGVDILVESIQWNSDGSVHSYGSPVPGFKVGHNILTSGINSGQSGGSNCGVLRTIGGDIGFQMISTGTTTNGGLQYLKSGTFTATASFSTEEGIPEGDVGKRFKATSAKVSFANTASGGRAFSLYLKDQSGTLTQVISNVTTVDSSNIIKEYYQDQSGVKINAPFEAMSIIGSISTGSGSTDCPILKEVEITYEPLNIEDT